METPDNVLVAVAWLLGGLALFLHGIELMGDALRRGAGPVLRGAFERVARSRFHGLATGTLVTALIQSSSATTVMVVGFINAGLITFPQSIGLILGANLGTSITPEITALNIDLFALPMLGLGLLIGLTSKRRAWRETGHACMGFGMLFFGLILMKLSVAGYRDGIRDWLNLFAGAGPLGMVWTFLISTAVTAIIQGSAATIVMTQALAAEGAITRFDVTIPILLGAGVGTCVTALLASLEASRSAKRAALAHLIFNVIGALITVVLYQWYVRFVPQTADSLPRQIANGNLLIRLVNVAVFLPFTTPFARLVTYLFPGEDTLNAAPEFLNFRETRQPARALADAADEVKRVYRLCTTLLTDAVDAFVQRDQKAQAMVRRREGVVDDLHRTISAYLVKVSRQEIPAELAHEAPLWMHVMGDVERLGDHAENIVELAELYGSAKAGFSDEALENVACLRALVVSLAESVERALREQGPDCMADVLTRKQAINAAVDRFLDGHAERVRAGACSVTTGMIFVELIMNLRRAANHLRNIAASVTSRRPEHAAALI